MFTASDLFFFFFCSEFSDEGGQKPLKIQNRKKTTYNKNKTNRIAKNFENADITFRLITVDHKIEVSSLLSRMTENKKIK